MTFEEEKFFEMHLTSDHRGIVIIFTIRNTSIFDIQSKYNNIRFVEIKSSSKRINHSTDPSAITLNSKRIKECIWEFSFVSPEYKQSQSLAKQFFGSIRTWNRET